ncbi:MAG: YcaO-like family protein [Candidatus Diapherotrites archaeon ADurb.Bin253]|nr:MAG: YcaO-like family protein [Candidatus Diapherotrites archaeon ADurb.Bin253]
MDNPNQEFVIDSYNNIKDSALDPSLFINFRDSDLNFRKQDYIKKIKDSKLKWVEATNLQGGSKVLVPAQLVYVDFDFTNEPMIRPRVSTGAAANESLEKALYSGIMENIERDSYMISYLSKKQLPKINLEKGFPDINNYFKRYLLDLQVFETTTDLEIPSFMCLNIDRTGLGPAISVGLNASVNPREGILGSIKESQQVRQWIRNLWIQKANPKNYSKEDVKEIEDRGFYWYDLAKIKELDYLLNPQSLKDIQEIKPPKTKEELQDKLRKNGIDTYYVDLTHPVFKDAGFFVVRVIQPQLHPLFLDESFPCYHSDRLNKELNGKEVNRFLHPFM